jgi:hypothetical protein
VPGIPGSLNAVAAGETSIRLTWSGISEASGYYIYRSGSFGGSYSQVGSITLSTYTDNGLAADTSYYYQVAAYNSAGTGTRTAMVSARTNAPGGLSELPPTQPDGLVISTPASSGLALSWNPVNNAAAYYVYRANTSTYAKIGETASTAYTDSSIPQERSYYYKVSAVNSSGGESPRSTATFGYSISHYALQQSNEAQLMTFSYGQSQYCRLPVTKNSQYTIEWQDGNGNDTGGGYYSQIHLYVSAWQNDGTSIFANATDGYTNPRVLTASTDGFVTIEVKKGRDLAETATFDYKIYYY